MVSTLQHREEMHNALKNPKMNDYDKVNKHATKLQQYLNKLQLALTRSKTSAILGTPLGETIPINADNEEMDVESDSDSDSDGVSIGQQSAQPSTFYTPMRTPSTALRALSPPTTPNNTATSTPRRRVTGDT